MRLPHVMRASGRLWLTGVLVLALLWTQALGLVHRVMHVSVQASHVQVIPVPGQGPHAHAGVWNHLKHAASDASDCRLYDQLVHDQGAIAESGSAPAGQCLYLLPSILVRRQAADVPHYFDARGPPHLG